MKKPASLKHINKRYHAEMKKIIKGSRESEIFDSLASGKNSYLRLDRLESSSFDNRWIDMIEDVIFDLGDIIANPKMTTKVEGALVPVELARKTNAESVQHLASHTQYIKEVDEYGNVIPSKLLSMYADDDIKTYENRFIATFVRRLVLFIEKRYEFVSKFAELHDEEVLYFKNKSVVDGSTVEIETKIKISHKSDDEISLQSNAYVAKIKELRDYILYFYSSPFMKQLKTEKDVHNPIIQTNIIRKNPKYHHCYEVYRFIETYEHLGVSYRVDENYSLFTDEELDEINRTLFANYITLKGKDRSKEAKTNSKVYKPRILTSMDDESFIYGPLLNGPISFVRVDEPYQEYLDAKLNKDLPEHPTKKEKEYYADEYAEKAENKEDLKQKELLLKRKEKEVRDFEKQAAKIDEEREKARLALLKQEKQLIKKEEDELLEEARKAIIAESLLDKKQTPEEIEAEEKALIANIKPAQVPVEMSHPYQDPVTYDEAVEEIWPQLKAKPTQEVSEEQPQVQEQPKVVPAPKQEEVPQKEPVPAVIPTPMSHPHQDPVTYDEAVEQIWPQIKEQPKPEQPSETSKPEEAKVSEEAPKEKEIVPVIVEVPVPMSHPHQDPVTYDEATLEIWPQLANAPKEAPKREKVVQPVPVNEPKQINKEDLLAPEKKDVQPVPIVEPVPMSHPAQEPMTYDEAVLSIWPQIADAPKEAPKREESAPQKVEPDHNDEQPAKQTIAEPIVVKPKKTKIVGRFIIHTHKGYYVSNGSYSPNTKDAYVFHDYEAAKTVKKLTGGVIIKIL